MVSGVVVAKQFTIPRVLTIAGSDSGGGAGIQADLKTCSALGVYCSTAITAVTAQNTLGVTKIKEMSLEMVDAQINAVLGDIGADVVKIGMLANTRIIQTVVKTLTAHGVEKLVVDPVMVAKSGDRLLREDAVNQLCTKLLPLATVVTPNIPEAEIITGRSIKSTSDLDKAGLSILSMGVGAVVIKGGHMSGTPIDTLFTVEGKLEFSGERVDTRSTHGTGCTFAAAIAACLAKGFSLTESIMEAKAYVTGALRAATTLGHGFGPVNHFFRCHF